MTLTRRALLTAFAASPVAACGFEPVYMPSAGGEAGVAQSKLAAVYVNILPDRPGQLLRQALQQRLQGAGDSGTPEYTLSVTYWVSGAGIGIQPDTAPTYIRYTGNANWTLTGRDPAQTHITSGSTRVMASQDLLDTQYFNADLQSDQIYRFLAQAVADQITLRLAIFFRQEARHG
jgi:LPS-assembly lipoprotein